MALGIYTGFEGQSSVIDNITFTGTASYSTGTKRTGSASIWCHPGSGASGYIEFTSLANYLHFGFYILSSPFSLARYIVGDSTSGTIGIKLNTDRTLSVYEGANLIGTTSSSLSGSTWYWLGIRQITGTGVVFLQIDGKDAVTGTATLSGYISKLGTSDTASDSISCFYDDLITNSEFLPPSKVNNLVPISDNANTGWVRGAGTTNTNLYIPVSTVPPPGVASANETDNTNIECASSSANSYSANLTTYSSAGIWSEGSILAVQPVIRHGEDISTNTKAGTVELTSNPTIGTLSFNFGNDAGAHAAETSSPLWFTTFAGSTVRPSVTLSSSPVMKVVKTTASTRVACVDYMALLVVWTPISPFGQAQASIKATSTKYAQAAARVNMFGNTEEGSVRGYSTTYTTAADTGNNTQPNLLMGQYWDGVGYNCYETFLGFDLSQIPANVIITSAILRCNINADQSTTDFTIYGAKYDFGGSVETTDFRSRAQLAGLTKVIQKSTVGIPTEFDFSDTGSGLASVIVPNSINRFILWSSRHEGSNVPTGIEQIDIDTSIPDTMPRLLVTWVTAYTQNNAQAQAQIKQTYKVVAQAQAIIINIKQVNAQAQTHIKTTYNTFAQSQAQIKRFYNSHGQACARILGLAYAQARAIINTGINSVTDTFTRTWPNALGQADVGGTWEFVSGTSADFDVDGSKLQYTQSSALIGTWQLSYVFLTPISEGYFEFTANSFSSTGANYTYITLLNYTDTFNYNGPGVSIQWYASDGTSALLILKGFGNNIAIPDIVVGTTYAVKYQIINFWNKTSKIRAKIWDTSGTEPGWLLVTEGMLQNSAKNYGIVSFIVGPGTGTSNIQLSIDNIGIKNISWTESGQAQSKIKAFGVNTFGQAQADITGGAVYTQIYAQAQGTILTYYQNSAQAQVQIKQSYISVAQAQATIRGNAFAQSQASIKQMYAVTAQASSWIKQSYKNCAQAQADIKTFYPVVSQVQAQIKQVYQVVAQTQAQIKQSYTAVSQAQADIKQAYKVVAQAQAGTKATSNSCAQAQTRIKASYTAVAQSQATIKQIYSGLAQAQTQIKQSYTSTAQAQADTKRTYEVWAQTQADIKQFYLVNAQAQSNIKQSYVASAQSQTSIKAISNMCAQAQSDIKTTYNRFAQSQGTIKTSYQGSAQASSTIKSSYQGYSQVQSTIKNTYIGYAQALAAIKGNAFAQANANIKQVYQGYAQAQSTITNTYLSYAQALATIISTIQVVGQSQAQIYKPVSTYDAYGQSQAIIKQVYSVYAQAQTNLKQSYQGLGQSQARIGIPIWLDSFSYISSPLRHSTNIVPEIGSPYITNDIIRVSDGYIWAGGEDYGVARGLTGFVSAGIIQFDWLARTTFDVYPYILDLYGWRVAIDAQEGLIAVLTGQNTNFPGQELSTQSLSPQAAIAGEWWTVKVFVDITSTTGKIKSWKVGTLEPDWETSTTIVTSYPTLFTNGQIILDAQTNSSLRIDNLLILNLTSGSFGIRQEYSQVQANIKTINNAFSQVRTKIKSTYPVFAQAQALIILTGLVVTAQANANIISTYAASAQSQSTIKQSYQGYGQVQGQIKATYVVSAQAQATIKQVYSVYAQTTAYIKIVDISVSAQAQAHIKQIYSSSAQAQAYLYAYGISAFAQAQATLFGSWIVYAQALSTILSYTIVTAQSLAAIKSTYTGLSQAQATIRGNAFAQAQAQIKTSYSGYAQAQSIIKQIYSAQAQAQALIKQTYSVTSQAQSDIKQTYSVVAQAQANIKQIYNRLGQAQAYIILIGLTVTAQVNALIKSTYVGLAQTQANIKATYNAVAQSQAQIKQVYLVVAQAQSAIKQVYTGLAQAQTSIKQIYYGWGQSQAYITIKGISVNAQAQAAIIQIYHIIAQAQGYIRIIDIINCAQALAIIVTTVNALGQSQAKLYTPQYARPISDIANSGWEGTVRD